MVTAELAMTLPALVLVTGLLMWAIAVVSTQMRCVDVARTAARSLARGDSETAATAVARALDPGQATIQLSRVGGTAVVRVVATVDPPGGLDAVTPTITVSSTASVPVEEMPWPAG